MKFSLAEISLCLIVLFLSQAIYPQSQSYHLRVLAEEEINKNIPKPISDSLDLWINAYNYYQINPTGVDIGRINESGGFSMQFKDEDENIISVDLEPNDLRSNDFQTIGLGKGGLSYPERAENITFKGAVATEKWGSTRVSITDKGITGLIRLNGENYFIEPASRYFSEAENSLHIVYNQKDVVVSDRFICNHQTISPWKISGSGEDGQAIQDSCKRAKIAIAADSSMVVKFGSIENVKNEILTIFNIVESRYMLQSLNIAYEIRTLFISEADDPWIPNQWGNPSMYSLLGNFRNWGNGGGFQTLDFAVASLWTAVDFDGQGPLGVSNQRSLCSQFRYNVNNHFSSNMNQLVQIQAHEIGHGWNAFHTPNQNNTYIMAPGIGQLNDRWLESNIPLILEQKAELNCLSDDCINETDIHVEATFMNVTTCPGEMTGSIELNVSGGTPPYSFLWSNGSTAEDLVNIPGGEYFVVISDSAGDSLEVSYFIQSPAPFVYGSQVLHHCDSVNLASFIELWVLSNPVGYSYQWSTGDTTQFLNDIVSGTYTVTVTQNETGCTVVDTVQVPEYAPTSLDFIDIVPSECGRDNGSAVAVLNGGAEETKIIWSGVWIWGDTATNLPPGDIVVNTLTGGCEDSDTITIPEIPILEEKNAEICVGAFFLFGEDTLYTSGLYQKEFILPNGCDSIVELNLSAIEIDTEIVVDGNFLSSSQANAEYQWLDCDENFKQLEGQSDRVLEIERSGNYALRIEWNGCVDTTSCVEAILVGLDDILKEPYLEAYPNPTDRILIVKQLGLEGNSFGIYNSDGRKALQGVIQSEILKIDLSGLPAGIYYLSVEDGLESIKIIKN